MLGIIADRRLNDQIHGGGRFFFIDMTDNTKGDAMQLICKTLLVVVLVLGTAGAVWAQEAPAAEAMPQPAASFDLAKYEGSVILVDFWASWCVPCRHSLPWLNAMQEKYGDQGLQIVTINLDKKPAAAQKMAATLAPGIGQFSDPEGTLAAHYELEGMPSSYLYDRTGQLITGYIGLLKADGDKPEAEIQAALEGK
jgi:thiol-disulfide isomerase/thioredoxin